MDYFCLKCNLFLDEDALSDLNNCPFCDNCVILNDREFTTAEQFETYQYPEKKPNSVRAVLRVFIANTEIARGAHPEDFLADFVEMLIDDGVIKLNDFGKYLDSLYT